MMVPGTPDMGVEPELLIREHAGYCLISWSDSRESWLRVHPRSDAFDTDVRDVVVDLEEWQ